MNIDPFALQTLSHIAWVIGASLMVIGGCGIVGVTFCWSLDRVIQSTKYGKEFWAYCKWKRVTALQSRVQRAGEDK